MNFGISFNVFRLHKFYCNLKKSLILMTLGHSEAILPVVGFRINLAKIGFF